MNKKQNLVLLIVFTLTLIVSLCGATFAYFQMKVPSKSLSPIELTSAVLPTANIINGSDIYLHITANDMEEKNARENEPIKTATNEEANKITFDFGETEKTMKCVYSIYYEPSTKVYKKSKANVNNLKEFTISGHSEIYDITIPETRLENVDSRLTLLSGQEITMSGIGNGILAEKWKFTISYYNQNFNQDEHQNESFGGQTIISFDSPCTFQEV